MTGSVEVSVSLPSPTVFWRAEGTELGTVIRAHRKARCLTIEALAGKAGMHSTYLSSIERGKRNLTWDRLSDLAEALDIPVSVLAREAEDQRIKGAINAAATDAYQAAVTNHDDAARAGP